MSKCRPYQGETRAIVRHAVTTSSSPSPCSASSSPYLCFTPSLSLPPNPALISSQSPSPSSWPSWSSQVRPSDLGFGMYFSYLKNLIWNGIGFAFFITAFSIELYPLINALWSKVGIHSNKMYADSFSTRNYYLSVSTVSSQQY